MSLDSLSCLVCDGVSHKQAAMLYVGLHTLCYNVH